MRDGERQSNNRQLFEIISLSAYNQVDVLVCGPVWKTFHPSSSLIYRAESQKHYSPLDVSFLSLSSARNFPHCTRCSCSPIQSCNTGSDLAK